MAAVPLTDDEIRALKCARRSGLEPAPGTVDRMLATITQLQRELVAQGQRYCAAIERGDVAGPEARRHEFVTAQVDSRAPDDPHHIGLTADGRRP